MRVGHAICVLRACSLQLHAFSTKYLVMELVEHPKRAIALYSNMELSQKYEPDFKEVTTNSV